MIDTNVIAAFFAGAGTTALFSLIVWMVRRIRYLEEVLNKKRRKREDTHDFWDAQSHNVAMKYKLEAVREYIDNQIYHLDAQNDILGRALNRDTKK